MNYLNDGVLGVESVEVVYKCRKITPSGELLIPQEIGVVWKCEFVSRDDAADQLAKHYGHKYGDFELPEGIVIVKVVKHCDTSIDSGIQPRRQDTRNWERSHTTVPTDSQITQAINER